MKNLSGQESLWVAFPILVVILILITGLIFLPRAQTEIRSKASEPTPSIITPRRLTPAASPEIICSDLYSPVCGKNGQTYSNPCEANLAGVSNYDVGRCLPTSEIPTMQYPLPITN
ncbi:MAG: Secreted protease and protease inhibitor [Candidatus Collierbacteria bacterium GW2011_GWC2_44_18]|uniref:Secreted protease and protease inhibitor n=1 Tax=Candidatus Collierbacteria bacterium GW2011_GWC2_44_18 TaxID=1618392 RepID=A0A0G1HQ52_9BACT|nr:MAG: secreted protease and protease inhibitor [Microgenomates group bacterium GW2011_GWC1_44_10]KKT49065.1 MAG: Secreted protease and protease inhibitor [Candidatus Collierbacteria bacterium GW2011_GWC2_44_18]